MIKTELAVVFRMSCKLDWLKRVSPDRVYEKPQYPKLSHLIFMICFGNFLWSSGWGERKWKSLWGMTESVKVLKHYKTFLEVDSWNILELKRVKEETTWLYDIWIRWKGCKLEARKKGYTFLNGSWISQREEIVMEES